jgi:hypothetical protein
MFPFLASDESFRSYKSFKPDLKQILIQVVVDKKLFSVGYYPDLDFFSVFKKKAKRTSTLFSFLIVPTFRPLVRPSRSDRLVDPLNPTVCAPLTVIIIKSFVISFP